MGADTKTETTAEGQRAMLAISKALQGVAGWIDKRLQRIGGLPVAFSLFVWTEGRVSYISTAERAEVIAVLKKMIERWEAGLPDVPAHEVQ